MMYPPHTEMIARERRNDLMREAKRHRLLQTLSPTPSSTRSIPQRILGSMGAQMVYWGNKMIAYGTLSPVNTASARVTDCQC